MRLLVLGAGGQVGRALLERAGSSAIGLDRAQCDICDPVSVSQALSVPDISVVVNCAAYTAVDRAESERDRAFAVNSEGAAIVARAAALSGAPIIHLSTDYVYAGKWKGPHGEDEPPAPANVYGESKAAGDAAVIEANPKHLLLRVSWVFGIHGRNFVKTMLRLGHEREELRVVDDQVGGPTEARDIADAILSLAAALCRPDCRDWGVYHFAGAPQTSWYNFAKAIFDRTKGRAPRLIPISTSEYAVPAKRPVNSVLDCSKIGQVFGIDQPDWRASLSRVVDVIEQART